MSLNAGDKKEYFPSICFNAALRRRADKEKQSVSMKSHSQCPFSLPEESTGIYRGRGTRQKTTKVPEDIQNSLRACQKFPSTLTEGLDSFSLGKYIAAWSPNFLLKFNFLLVPDPKHMPTYIKKGTGYPTSVSMFLQHKAGTKEEGLVFTKQRSSLYSLSTPSIWDPSTVQFCRWANTSWRSPTPSCSVLSLHAQHT